MVVAAVQQMVRVKMKAAEVEVADTGAAVAVCVSLMEASQMVQVAVVPGSPQDQSRPLR